MPRKKPKMIGRQLIGILALMCSATACAQQDAVELPKTGPLEQRLPATFSGQVVIGGPTEIIANASFGLADRKENLAVSNETLFDIGSLTKQFTAAGILKLVEQEQLSLDDPLDVFFDDLPPPVAAMTVHDLLTHTSGMPNGSGGDYSLRTRASFDQWLHRVSLKDADAKSFDYSNAGYSVLARIIEIRSGKDYEAFLAENLWRPAGLKDIGYVLPSAAAPEAVGYRNGGKFGTPRSKKWMDDGPSWNLRGNGGILASAETLHKWTSALDSGKVLSQSSIDLLFARQVIRNEERGVWYGYGWDIRDMNYGERISHTGGNLVFFAYVEYLKDQQCILTLTNNAFSDVDMGKIVGALRAYTLEHADECV